MAPKQYAARTPSADTVEYACQQLKTPTQRIVTPENITHQLNHNPAFNRLLVKLAVRCGQLRPTCEQGYTLDYDNVVLENDKQDARYSYKKTKAYHPGFAFIGRIPVHVENRNGNTPASYGQKDTLERCLSDLEASGIPIAAFRGDNTSYQKEAIRLMDGRGIRFYIRMLDFKGIRDRFAQVTDWQPVRINHHRKEVASISYGFDRPGETYRVVVTRVPQKGNGQLDAFEGRSYRYQAIITNDTGKTGQQVIEFYNQRGDSEKSNCYLLNDFNIGHLPFMDLDTNTVYMYLMAICATLFEWTKHVLVGNKAPGISPGMRVKAVFFHYIAVAATWINHARKRVLRVFSNRPYRVLQI